MGLGFNMGTGTNSYSRPLGGRNPFEPTEQRYAQMDPTWANKVRQMYQPFNLQAHQQQMNDWMAQQRQLHSGATPMGQPMGQPAAGQPMMPGQMPDGGLRRTTLPLPAQGQAPTTPLPQPQSPGLFATMGLRRNKLGY